MFKKILIANRGEIAVRVIRACKEMGIKTVAVHSEPDKNSLHVKLADESVCIGPGPASESYLNIPNIISAAEISGADAIHPGYGFLSENTYFADVCESCHIHFIGPSKEAIEKMGDKAAARETMRHAGVPIIPGSDGCISADDPNLLKIARKVGYPLIVKACSGGGGKGMRVIENEDALVQTVKLVQTEAKAAFGSDQVYLERYLKRPRHIEIQIMGDSKGKVIYLPERECSIQRRHQKLIEESPSSVISEKLRKKMGKAARKAAEAVDYVTVGTVEFLLDDEKDEFYFLEMNTRIQVEHTVTEMVTGIDLVKEQIKLAAGERLTIRDDVSPKGHAIECRVNAEDPDHDFRPSPGAIKQVILPGPPGVRVDTHIYSGYVVPTYYDSLLAKLIVLGDNREDAIRRMQRALGEFTIEGVKTTIPLHQKILGHELFRKGDTYTDFVAKNIYGNTNGNGAKHQ
jgi:acetyl-CoA carboxylase, biotin carboxylase subunit